MKTKIFLLSTAFLISAFLFCGCGMCSKKIDCPGFNDTLLSRLFPYNDNQRLRFLSDSNEQVSFTLKNTETTQPYQATGSGDRMPVCTAQKIFESVEKDSLRRSLFSVWLNSDDIRDAELTINTSSIRFTDFTSTSFGTITINGLRASLQTVASLTLSNRTFTDVIVAFRDTSNSKLSGVYKIYYTQAKGLVAYGEYPLHQTWVKQ